MINLLQRCYHRAFFVSLPDAARIATREVQLIECDWNVFREHLHLGDLYMANALTLHTTKKLRQAALPRLDFYAIGPYGMRKLRASSDASVRDAPACMKVAYVYVDDRGCAHEAYLKRSALRRWLRVACSWDYLFPERFGKSP